MDFPVTIRNGCPSANPKVKKHDTITWSTADPDRTYEIDPPDGKIFKEGDEKFPVSTGYPQTRTIRKEARDGTYRYKIKPKCPPDGGQPDIIVES